MKRIFVYIIVVQAIMLSACKKDDPNFILNDFIVAGQTTGVGIDYTNLEPDINCIIIDPWENTDTTITLDLNKDGINDFVINGTMCHPSMLGGDCENFSITPFLQNEICINPITNWLDTIPNLDTINIESNWSNDEALIYSYFWVMGESSTTEGHWQDVSASDKYFIGIKILKEDKTYMGWIGIKRDPPTRPFSFFLTDYALLKEY